MGIHKGVGHRDAMNVHVGIRVHEGVMIMGAGRTEVGISVWEHGE